MNASTITYSDFRPVASLMMAASGWHGLNQAAANGCGTLAQRFVR